MTARLETVSRPPQISRLREFVIGFGTLLDSTSTESVILREGASLLKDLIRVDDWLPARYAEPDLELCRQYLLHADSRERFSVVSLVWGPRQTTPIHDHTVWGLIGILRGKEHEQHYVRTEHGRLVEHGAPHFLAPGEVDVVWPTVGDLHRVSNALSDHVSISIHVYGANIGGVRRWIYESSGARKPFISGYSDNELPNPWDRSKEAS
jgi:predicted metal-dependent enzyme (double-stranded beta helix superfamily)